ncbi:MAG: SUMF1/EgtB/PvdO family nonheme iron enzyme [Bacteroidota bacterium]
MPKLLWLMLLLLLVGVSTKDGIQELKLPIGRQSLDASSTNRFSTGEKYLHIDNVKTQPDQQRLTFDVSWDASWRVGDEFDAAWIFIKSKDKNGDWSPVSLKQQTAVVLANFSSDKAAAALDISPDGMGIMVSRKMDGVGDNYWKVGIQIAVNPTKVPVAFRVFGLEMVQVSAGAYELGTLKGESARRAALTQGAGGAPYNPFFKFDQKAKDDYGGIFKVTSEDPISIGKEDGLLYWKDANIPGTNTFSGTPKGVLSEKFPKGVKGFFQMKYELSQKEYCDFLNTLSPLQQKARDITSTKEFNRPISDYRNAITYEDGEYTTTRPFRPCNFISWLDGQAYADWAGLRHMTELEFEKACRGPKPAVYREYVWGVNEINEGSNMRYSTTLYNGEQVAQKELGNETTDGNIHASMFSYYNYIDVCTTAGRFYDPQCAGCRSFTGGDGGRGPVCKGIFGKTSKGNRIKAGATYYGAMEMGGNLQEPVVTVGHPSGRKFEGTHGDGLLDVNGLANNLDWQPINQEYAFAGRGGCWKFHENHARTADRFKGLRKNENRRAAHIGFRGVRTNWK